MREQAPTRVGPSAERVPEIGRSGSRLYFVDHLRVFLTILVVVHHVAVTYSGLPIWYYTEPTQSAGAIPLLLFILINQGFFMGLFFMISAYFAPPSFDRKGTGSFLKERLLRLAVPLALFYFVIGPATTFAAGIYQGTATLDFETYLEYLGFGPAWFLEALLVFTLLYVIFRYITRNRERRMDRQDHRPLTYRMVAAFTVALTVVTFLWRIIVPMGFWTPVIDFPTLSYLPQYAGLFVVGVIAYRNDWFRKIPDSMGRAGWIAALISTLVLFPLTFLNMPDSMGGGNWEGIFYAAWDSTFSVSVALGLLTFFRKRLNGESRLGTFLSKNSFAVFIFHPPVIVVVAIALGGLAISPLVKFGIAAVIGVPLCFVVANLIRKLPLVSKVL